jgi:multiple sugar transport system substrate-binding protein
MKKSLWLLLTLSLVGSVVFAGGTRQSGSSAASAKPQITILEWGELVENDPMDARIARYQTEHNVAIERTIVPYDDYPQKLATVQAAGDLTMILHLEEHRVLEFGSLGLLKDLRPLFAAEGIDIDDWYIANQMFKSGNAVYGHGAAGAMNVMFYNKTLLTQAGVAFPPDDVTRPWTWDQFVDALTKLTRDNRGRTPADPGFDVNNVVQWGTALNDWWIYTLPHLYAAGTSMVNAEGTALEITKPAGIDAIQKFADLRLKNRVAAPEGSFPSRPVALMNGQIAIMIEGQWGFSEFQRENFTDAGMAQIPSISGRGSNMVWGAGTTLTNRASQEAFDFYKWYYNTERNVEDCERLGRKFDGIVLTKNVLNDPALNARFQQLIDPVFSRLTSDIADKASRIGENITLKNFTPIMYEYVQPAIELAITGDATVEEAFRDLDAQTRNLFQGTY